ncbi:MAG: hybrid sensor histidine kinase/response regulator [Planctomycetota bacterium]
MGNEEQNLRILVVDDNPSIHEDFKKILGAKGGGSSELDALSDDFFGDAEPAAAPEIAPSTAYDITTASQGQEALELVKAAAEKRQTFAMAFVDVRMPPGWDGITTIAELWKVDPDLQVVVCTAFSDYSYDEILEKLGRTDKLLILKKPFDSVEVQQMALALTAKRNAQEREKLYVEEIKAYTASLETVNRALQSDKATAEAYSRAKQDFILRAGEALGSPAHRLLDGLSQAVDTARQDPNLARALEEILPEAGDLVELVDQIMDLTKLEGGETQLEQDSVDFFEVLRRIESVGSRHASLRGVGFALKQRSVLPSSVVGDPKWLESLLENLVRGCIDVAAGIAPAGSQVEAVLSLEQAGSLHHDSLVFEVKLGGTTLTPAQQQSLFEPFDASLSSKDGRLYLPLARQISRLHGSSIDVRTGEAEGTTIRLNLDPGPLEGVELKLRGAA